MCKRLLFARPVPGWAVRRMLEFSRINYPNRLFSGYRFYN